MVFVLGGCGGTGINHNNPDGSTKGSDGAGDGSDNAGWTTLISRDWSIGAGQQTYDCIRIQTTQEYWINGFRALSPLGTHHQVLTIDPDDSQTGEYPCNAETGDLTGQMVYAAGIGTGDLIFPTGDAVHLPAGTWINLNLHLFDVSDNPLMDTSGVLIQTVDPSTVVNEVDMTFSGTVNIAIPAMTTMSVSGGCTSPADWHVFALWPHMHQIGIHQKLTAGSVTMLDTDYSFDEQKAYPMAEMEIPQGAAIQTTCTYDNTTSAEVDFGQSSTDEMCFTGIYKYPAGGGTFGCVTGIP